MNKKDKQDAVKEAEEIAQAAAAQSAEQVEENPLQGELDAAKKAADDYKDKWMRAAAEFENYKKRNAEIRRVSYLDGMAEAIVQMLPACDAMDRALTMPMDDKTREGVEMIAKKLGETLKNMGLEEINPACGEAFDPNFHDAVMQVAAEEGETEGTVKDVFVKGYKLNGKIIRYAQVRVIG